MAMTPGFKRATQSLLLVLSLCPALASAGLIDIFFKFSSNSGPLNFTDNIGSFQYDDVIVPVGGGQVNGTSLFTDLSVSFAGNNFDETTANGGWLDFSSDGSFEEAFFGNNCGSGTCSIDAGLDNWWLRVGVPSVSGISTNTFKYSGFSSTDTINYASSETGGVELIISVPEPSTLTLLVFGLLGILMVNRVCQQTTARQVLVQNSLRSS